MTRLVKDDKPPPAGQVMDATLVAAHAKWRAAVGQNASAEVYRRDPNNFHDLWDQMEASVKSRPGEFA